MRRETKTKPNQLASNNAAGPVGTEIANAERPLAAPIIECPPELGPVARQEWDRLIGELTATGVVTIYDRAPLAMYCDAYERWIHAVEQINKYGAVMKAPSGYPVQSLYLSIANRQVEIMLRLATEYGFTPASRGQRGRIARGEGDLLDSEELGAELKPLGDLKELRPLKL